MRPKSIFWTVRREGGRGGGGGSGRGVRSRQRQWQRRPRQRRAWRAKGWGGWQGRDTDQRVRAEYPTAVQNNPRQLDYAFASPLALAALRPCAFKYQVAFAPVQATASARHGEGRSRPECAPTLRLCSVRRARARGAAARLRPFPAPRAPSPRPAPKRRWERQWGGEWALPPPSTSAFSISAGALGT